jgi:HD-like signal output (HDOD) protein
VAANSYVLAQQKRHLKPEDAMLAGLVHDIGALPLYLYADRHYPEINPTTLEEMISKFSASVGIKLLQSWNFPAELVNVVVDHENQRRIPLWGAADYVDVVTMAKLQIQAATAQTVSWRNVFAAERLGYYPGDCRNFVSNHAEQFAAVNDMLGIGVAQAA